MVNFNQSMKGMLDLTIVLISCGVQPLVGYSLQSNSSIIGKWEITSNRAVGEPKFENFSKDGSGSFFALFGVTYWVPSEGESLLEFSCKFPKDSIRNIIPVKYEIIGDKMP